MQHNQAEVNPFSVTLKKHLLSRQVSDVDKGVVEGGKDVTNSKDILSLGHLGTKADHLLFLLLLAFAGSHCLVDKDRTVILTQLKPNS